jgi:hypothetical protein
MNRPAFLMILIGASVSHVVAGFSPRSGRHNVTWDEA